jgi:hypothetical protein
MLGATSAWVAGYQRPPTPLPDRIWVVCHEEHNMIPAGPCYEDTNRDREISGYEFESTGHWLTMRWVGGAAATVSAAREIDNRLREPGTRYLLSGAAYDPQGNRLLVYERRAGRSQK